MLNKRYLLFLSLCINACFSIIFAQNSNIQSNIDSLKKALITVPQDTHRVRILNSIAAKYAEKDTAQAFKYYAEAFNLATKIKDTRGIIDAYYNYGFIKVTIGKYEECLQAYNKALDLAQKNNELSRVANTYNAMGKALVSQGKRKESIQYLEQARVMMEKLGMEVALGNVLNNLTVVYNQLGENEKSMQIAFKGLEIADKLKDYGLESTLCNNISKILNDTKRYREAIEYSIRSTKASEKIGDERMLGIAYINLANQYEDGLQEHQKAIDLYKKSLAIFKKIGFTRGVQVATNNLAAMMFRQGDNDESLRLYKENLALGEKGENKVGLPMNYMNIGKVYQKKGDLKEAKMYFEKAEEIGKKYAEMPTMLEIYTFRAVLDSVMGNYQSAFLYRNKQLIVQDSMLNEKTNRSLSDMKVKYESEKKQQQISLLNAQNEVQKLTLARQDLALKNNALEIAQKNQSLQLASLSLENKELELYKTNATVREKELENAHQQTEIRTLNAENQVKALQLSRRNLWLGGLVTLFILSGLLAYTFYAKRKAAQEAALKQAISQQKIIAAKAVLEAEERERRRIAGDLHDGVAQLIVASKMHLASMGAKMNFKTDEERNEYEKVMALISESADEIRSVSHQMMPNALLRVGLVSALQEFIQKISSNQLSVYLDAQGLDQRLSADIETTLFRIVQECVNNVIKHAQASRLDIQLVRDDKELSLTIEDNGRGFDVAKALSTEGVGLKNLRNRVEYLNGTLDIESSPGKGTLLAIYLPLS